MADAQAQIAQAMRAFLGQLGTSTAGQKRQVEVNPAVQQLQARVRQQVQQPIPKQRQAVSVPVAPKKAEQAPAQAPLPSPEAAQNVPMVEFPPAEGAAVSIIPERPPTAEEEAARIAALSPTKLAAYAATPSGQANVDLGKLRQQEIEQNAKTAQQKFVNEQWLKILGNPTDDDSDGAKAGLMLRSITGNVSTGNLSFTQGLPTTEEQRTIHKRIISNALAQGEQQGVPAWQVLEHLKADPEDPTASLTPDQEEQLLINGSRQQIAKSLDTGMGFQQSIESAFRNWGVVPDELADYMSPAVALEMDKSQAREVGRTKAALTEPAEQLRRITFENDRNLDLVKRWNAFIAPDKPSQKDQDAMTAMLTASRNIQRISEKYKDAFVGILRGRISMNALAFFGLHKNGEAEMRVLLTDMLNAQAAALAGLAQTESEIARQKAALPQPEDSVPVFLAKLRLYSYNQAENYRLRIAMMAQAGKRWRGNPVMKEIDIGGVMTETIDIGASMKMPDMYLTDPSLKRHWNKDLERAAGIVIGKNGEVITIDPESGADVPFTPPKVAATEQAETQKAQPQTPSPEMQQWLENQRKLFEKTGG